jgi:hypothetical protein
MQKLLLITMIIALSPTIAVQAQSPDTAAAVSPESRKMCREAVLQICKPGSPPNRDEVRRCAAKNIDKLPPECALWLAASAQRVK